MSELDYIKLLEMIDVNKNDIIDVSSDLVSIMIYCRQYQYKFDPNHLIDALMKKVGSEGTVLIRTFSWDFCNGKGFDILHTSSQVGALGNIALKRSDMKRTKHPIYSWMVWGKFQDELCNMNNVEAFGEDSPFGFLYHHNAKHLRLGNTVNDVFTQRHYAELKVGIPFRYEKNFNGYYKDEFGVCKEQTYSMYVRRLDIDVSYELYLRYDEGIELINDLGNMKLASVDIRKAVDYIIEDLEKNNGINTVIINGQPGYQTLL